VLTILVAFLLGALWPGAAILIPVLAAVLLVGTFVPEAALFKQVYARLLRPAGLVRAQPVAESPKPHNFAQLLGGIFLALASLVFFVVSNSVIGWALALIVLALAALNLFFGF
jgi:hypothetical protein